MNYPKDVSLYRTYISSEPRFYKIKDIQEMTGWSEGVVQKLFNDPKFPASDYGKSKVVEAHALIQFFLNDMRKRGNAIGSRTER